MFFVYGCTLDRRAVVCYHMSVLLWLFCCFFSLFFCVEKDVIKLCRTHFHFFCACERKEKRGHAYRTSRRARAIL